MRVDGRALGLAAALALAGCSIVFQGDEHQANLGRDGAVSDDGGGIDARVDARTDGRVPDGPIADAPDLDGGGVDGTLLDAGDGGPLPPGRIVVLTGQAGLSVRFYDEPGTSMLDVRSTDSGGVAFYDYAEGETGSIAVLYGAFNVTSVHGVPAGSTVDLAYSIPMAVGPTTVTFAAATGATRYTLTNGCNEVDAAPAGVMIATDSKCVSGGEVEFALLARNSVFQLLGYQTMRLASPPPASLSFPDAWIGPTDWDVALDNTTAGAPYYPGVVAFFGQTSLWGQAAMAIGASATPSVTFTTPQVGDVYRLTVEHRDVGETVLSGTNFFTRGRADYHGAPVSLVFDVSVLPDQITSIDEDASSHEVTFTTDLVGDWVKVYLGYGSSGSWTIYAPGDARAIAPQMPFMETPLEDSPPTQQLSIEVIDRSDLGDFGTVLARGDREGVLAVGRQTTYARFDANM